jgi:hypothetical protein
MISHLVDERDTTWEQHESTFRVFVYSGMDRENVSVHEIAEATFSQTLDWARSTAGDGGSFAVALLQLDTESGAGLIWLVGMDAHDTPLNFVQHTLAEEL